MSCRLASLVGFVVAACAPAGPSTLPNAQPPMRATQLAAAKEPAPAPPPDHFAESCPSSDPKHAFRLLLELDQEVDWTRAPEDVTRDLVARLGDAAKECEGASVVAGPDGRSLSVALPKACGADAVRGKLELAFLPAGARDFATAQFDGQVGGASVAGRAYLDPSMEPKRACLVADLDHIALEDPKHRQTVNGPAPTPGDRLTETMRIQRAILNLFFPPLWLSR